MCTNNNNACHSLKCLALLVLSIEKRDRGSEEVKVREAFGWVQNKVTGML